MFVGGALHRHALHVNPCPHGEPLPPQAEPRSAAQQHVVELDGQQGGKKDMRVLSMSHKSLLNEPLMQECQTHSTEGRVSAGFCFFLSIKT